MAENNTENTDQPKPKGSTGTKIGMALAVSALGAKIGLIGNAMDAHAIVGDAGGWKMMRDKAGRTQVYEKAMQRVEQLVNEGKNPIVASFSLFKWTFIIGTLGSIAGGVLGWVRGGLIHDGKYVFKHPIKSAEIILGIKSPDIQDEGKEVVKDQTKWADKVGQKQATPPQPKASYTEAALQDKAQAASTGLSA